MPGAGRNLFNHATALRTDLALQNVDATQAQQTNFYPPTQSFNAFPPGTPMPPPLIHDNSMNATGFGQQSPVSPAFSMSGQQTMRTPTMGPHQPDPPAAIPPSWNGPLFDPSDPALFNFDLASMNFGNHYGALEFGMLGHMATGADTTPPSDTTTQRGSVGHPNGSNQYHIPLGSFSESPNAHRAFPYNDGTLPDWPNGQNLYGQQFQFSDGPHAYAIETNNANFTSPDSASSPPGLVKFEESPTMTSNSFRPSAVTSAPTNPPNLASGAKQQNTFRQPHISTPQLKAKSQLPVKLSKRPRDPSSIYTTVTSPYPYTTGFHSLIAYLQRRFAASPSKTLTIAKCLASFRPSFIATTETLNRDDLIFMEKCFQRTLWEYEGFIEGVGTPTIVARRTGEVAAVGKEFSILTGWKKDVLLGREPNLNVNCGGSPGTNSGGPGSGANTNSRGAATGTNTPTMRGMSSQQNAEAGDEKRLQPVFLAELLDDDSVVEFYEGFARLAFGDSRGSVMGKGKLLKYRTKEEQIALELKTEADTVAANQGGSKTENGEFSTGGADSGAGAHQPPGSDPSGPKRINSGMAKRQTELKKDGIAGEKGMQNLGFKDGKVECTYCWTVKRDVFDIPMLIVMNVSRACPLRQAMLPQLGPHADCHCSFCLVSRALDCRWVCTVVELHMYSNTRRCSTGTPHQRGARRTGMGERAGVWSNLLVESFIIAKRRYGQQDERHEHSYAERLD